MSMLRFYDKIKYLHWFLFVVTFLGVITSCKDRVKETEKINLSVNFDKKLEILNNPLNYSNQVLVTAHRGDWRNAPENSLEGMQFCIEMGIDIMETDIQITKDSVLILMHDETLDRTTTGIGYVKDWKLDSIKTLKLKNGYGEPTPYNIPTLEEALLFSKGKIIMDLDKSYPYLPQVYQLTKKTNTLNQVIFRVDDDWQSFKSKHQNFIPELLYMPLVWWNTKEPEAFISEYLQAPYPPFAFEVIYKKETSPQLVALEKLKKTNSHIMMNTVFPRLCAGHDDFKALENPDDSWGWIIDKGATIIGTDRPKLLLQYLQSKGLRN